MRGFEVELNNGQIFREWELEEKLPEGVRPWIYLKSYVRERNLKVISLILQFDHQKVFLPKNSKAYFYSRRVSKFLGSSSPDIQYYGVGAVDSIPDTVDITWYDGESAQNDKRQINEESPQFICNY